MCDLATLASRYWRLWLTPVIQPEDATTKRSSVAEAIERFLNGPERQRGVELSVVSVEGFATSDEEWQEVREKTVLRKVVIECRKPTLSNQSSETSDKQGSHHRSLASQSCLYSTVYICHFHDSMGIVL